MNDETHFTLSEPINKQNATEDEQSLHDQKVMLWCGTDTVSQHHLKTQPLNFEKFVNSLC